MWFGCRVDLTPYAEDPQGALAHLGEAVGMSLSEQQERLLDLTDEIIGSMVEQACPPNKHYEDWDVESLVSGYEEQFGIEASGVDRYSDAQELAAKLYSDAEAVLRKKEEDFGSESFLRLFRNLYLEEIDKQWLQHLQAMDHLRDGIGLRGYGQRDPKREYKREGFDMFRQMMQSTKSSVAGKLFRAERVREEDLEQVEERRRQQAEARQKQARPNHPASQDGGDSRQAAAAARAAQGSEDAAAARPQTVRRERPKLGRNEPCWCGSGKKYKQCHLREDQQAAPGP
jgi:preprotein translocase subunit SecA